MKNGLILMLVCILLFSAAFGCKNAAQNSEATAVPTVEPTAEPTPDPAVMIAEAEIAEGRHEREEGFSSPFKTRLIDMPLATVHMENGASYSDETLRSFTQTVVSDVLAIAAYTGEETGKVTVYVVERMLKNRPVLLRDCVFCTAADVESGAYREALCGACCGFAIPWKQVGLAACVFGTVDESGLAEYYADEAHSCTASCAAVYLLPDIADEETVNTAAKTAASLTAFLLENGGFDTLKTVVSTAEILPAWQEMRGIKTPLTLPEGNAQAAAMTADSDTKYRCVLHTGNLTINVSEGSFAQTPDELYTFVCKLYYGMEFVLGQIREEIPTYAELAETRFSEGFTVDLSIPGQNKPSFASSNAIWLVRESAVWHEIVHVLLKQYTDSNLWWVCEALAEHYSNAALSNANPLEDFANFDDAYPDTEAMPAKYLTFWKTVWPVIRAEREANVSLREGLYDDRAYERARGIGELLLSGNPLVWGDDPSVAGARGRDAGDPQTDGNGLTYSESMVLLEYLFDEYGAETVVTGYMNGRPISETCGKDYAELYADCVAYLRETYGALLQQ